MALKAYGKAFETSEVVGWVRLYLYSRVSCAALSSPFTVFESHSEYLLLPLILCRNDFIAYTLSCLLRI